MRRLLPGRVALNTAFPPFAASNTTPKHNYATSARERESEQARERGEDDENEREREKREIRHALYVCVLYNQICFPFISLFLLICYKPINIFKNMDEFFLKEMIDEI